MCAVAASESWHPMHARRLGLVFQVPLVLAAEWQDWQLRMFIG